MQISVRWLQEWVDVGSDISVLAEDLTFAGLEVSSVRAVTQLSKKIVVIDFILSCRAFGRSIEKSMLLKIIQVFKKKNIDKIIFKYLKTKKN